jgi:iron complex outermembrane receptor protein
MSIKTTLLFAIASVIGFALQAPQATAQQSATSGAVSESLTEIVVTARKREESLQDVPVVATVLSQQTIEQTQTNDLFALSTRVPGLLFGTSVNATGTQATLRGIGTVAINATMDQSVTLDIDGMPLSQGVAYGLGMFDVAQVAVLEGPQALFFGKNSTAGVISLRSADPTDKFESIVRVGYEEEARDKQTDFILSGPVSDSLKLRLAVRYDDQEGFFKNEPNANTALGGVQPTFSNFAPTKELIVRGTALYEPNEKLTARLKVNYDNYNDNGGVPELEVGYCPAGTAPVAPINIAFQTGVTCQLGRYVRLPWISPAASPGVPNQGIPFQDTHQGSASLELKFRPSSEVTLTSMTSYYIDGFLNLQAGDISSTVVDIPSAISFSNRQFTEELRLTSAYTDSPLNFMAGASYLSGREQNQDAIFGNTVMGLPAQLQDALYVINISSSSVFGQLLWNVIPTVELAAGARLTDEQRKDSETNLNTLGLQGAVGPVARPDPEISSSNVSPEVTVTYKPTNQITAYAAYKTGFKSGSFNSIDYTPANQKNSFADEKARGGEVGIKSRMDEGRLTANIAVYDYKYTNLQVGALEEQSGNIEPVVTTVNAASAHTRGVQFDTNYLPAAINGLALTGSVAYNNARYDSFPNAPCGNDQTIAQGCNQIFNPTTGVYLAQNLAGKPLVRAPDWTAYAGFEQTTSLGNKTLRFGAGANYTSEYSTLVIDEPGFVQPSFVKIDANLALSGPNDHWEVALIGKNLNNRLTADWCANADLRNGSIFGGQVSGAAAGGPAGPDESACAVQRGRELWGRVSYKW